MNGKEIFSIAFAMFAFIWSGSSEAGSTCTDWTSWAVISSDNTDLGCEVITHNYSGDKETVSTQIDSDNSTWSGCVWAGTEAADKAISKGMLCIGGGMESFFPKIDTPTSRDFQFITEPVRNALKSHIECVKSGSDKCGEANVQLFLGDLDSDGKRDVLVYVEFNRPGADLEDERHVKAFIARDDGSFLTGKSTPFSGQDWLMVVDKIENGVLYASKIAFITPPTPDQTAEKFKVVNGSLQRF